MDTYATDSNPIRIHTIVKVNPTTSSSASPSVSSPHLIEDVDNVDEDKDDANGDDVTPDDSSVLSNNSNDPLEDSHVSTPNPVPTRPTHAPTQNLAGCRHKQQKPQPVRPEDHLLAELWAARFGHLGNHNCMSSLRMLQDCLQRSELTLYVSLTTRYRLESVSADLVSLQLKRRSRDSVITWTLGSCVHQLVTTQSPHLPLTGWSPL